jgi:hypothetical protein
MLQQPGYVAKIVNSMVFGVEKVQMLANCANDFQCVTMLWALLTLSLLSMVG